MAAVLPQRGPRARGEVGLTEYHLQSPWVVSPTPPPPANTSTLSKRRATDVFVDDDDTTLKRQSSNVTVDAAVAARMAEMSATPAKPPSFIRRGSSLSVPPAFVPVSESDSAGPRKQAPVEMPVSEMVPVQPVGHLDGRVTKFTNCRILRGHKLVREDLWIRDGAIIDPETRFWSALDSKEYTCDEIIDCGGLIIAPGFIDIQINGAFGVDFSSPDLTDDDITTVALGLVKHGVTAFCPTIVSSSPAVYRAVVPKFSRYMREPPATWRGEPLPSLPAAILGLHLEGPFICVTKKGAHDETVIQDPVDGMESVKACYGTLDNVRIVTLAPERPGALKAVEGLVDNGVVVSMGHSSALAEDADAAVASGATLITHLFNAMGPFHHRDPGIIGLLGRRDATTRAHGSAPLDGPARPPSPDDLTAFDPFTARPSPLLPAALVLSCTKRAEELSGGPPEVTDRRVEAEAVVAPEAVPAAQNRVYYSLIVDGIHCHRYSASMVHRLHPAGLVLITDAMAAMGLPPGRHNLGTMHVDIFSGKHDGGQYDGLHALIAGTNTLAGALTPLDGCVRNLREYSGCSKVQALEAATLHPSQVLRLRCRLGTLEMGAAADLTLLDDSLVVRHVFIRGRLAYTRGKGE